MEAVFDDRNADGTVNRDLGTGVGPLKDLMSTFIFAAGKISGMRYFYCLFI